MKTKISISIFKIIFFLSLCFISYSQEESKSVIVNDSLFTEKIMMPDQSIFYLSKKELIWLKDYEELLSENVYKDRNEMLIDFKKVTISARLREPKRKEIEEIKRQNAELDKRIAEQEKQNAELDKRIAELNKTSKEMIRKWLGDKIVSEEKLDEINLFLDDWTISYNKDNKIIEKLENVKIKLSLSQINELKNIISKWSTFSYPDLIVIENQVKSLVNRAKNRLTK